MSFEHLRSLVAAFAAVGLIAPGADAALKKYDLQFTHIVNSTNASPNPDYNVNVAEPGSRAVIDDSGPSPVLKKLLKISDTSITTIVPQLGGLIYTSGYELRGPTGEFTGTGSTDTTIAWGLVTGWTTSGTWWCNASPAFICDLALRVHQESIDPINMSDFYDMGTWFFHGTGWTQRPWKQRTHDQPGGNDSFMLRGRLVSDGTVPALPFAGVVALTGSLVVGGLAALRRHRR